MKGGTEAWELSRQLAEMLGQFEDMPSELDGFGPNRNWNEGVLEEAYVPSESRDHLYRIVRSAGGWQHANADCIGNMTWGHCRHIDERNKTLAETQALTLASGNALAVIDELEDSDIAEGIRGQLEETWIYQFPQGGATITGVSAKGVENGCREMAKKGEVIRELDVRVDYEDEREARFVAKAGRYAVTGDGHEVLLDTAIRAKRQSKTMALRNGTEQFDKDWYEKGVTKAVRNAKLALMPDSIVALIIANAKQAGRIKLLAGNGQQQRQAAPRRELPPTTGNQATGQPNGQCEHEPKFDENSTLMVCTKCGLVMDEPPADVKGRQPTLA